MRLNRDVIIHGIIKHQSSFLALLDCIDNNDGIPEVPEKLYIDLYSRQICEDDDTNIHAQLSLNTLLQNGIFIHHDKNAGVISVSDVIIKMLRFIDVKRARELNRHDLEDLRQRVSDFVDKLLGCAYQDDDDTEDLFASFYRLLSEIHSKIKENVSALDAQVDKISLQYKEFNSGTDSTSVFELYDRVTELYDRYVLPCYEFIDPYMEMKGKKTLSQSVNELINYLATVPSKLNASNKLQYRFTAISSYYKDIGSLVRKLKQYSMYLEQDRERFIAIENAFNALMGDLVPLRHGKQKYKYLTPSASVFRSLSTLDGLREHKSSHAPKLNWVEERTRLRFKEYLNLLERTKLQSNNIIVKPLPAEVRVEEERQIQIANLIAQTTLPATIYDLHEFIFELLCSSLENFWLGDVLFGLQELMPYTRQDLLKYDQERCRKIYGEYYLDHLRIELQREDLNV
ncbi:MAG: hypothetical protein COB00_17415 [Alcanivorax sp.]|nr:MAG: hypothetical protein COB00_17415 [Alcanivorax sp.]